MIKNATIFTVLLGLFVACGQNSKPDAANKFLNFLNHYTVDSLQTLLADNFQLKRSYTSYTNDKKSFIENYVPNLKKLSATYKILTTANTGRMTEFLVEDQNDYYRYLNINYPKWKVQIVTDKQNQVELMTVDTTENYQAYVNQAREKSEQFESWEQQKYPNETYKILHSTTGLLVKRLKEFSNKQ